MQDLETTLRDQVLTFLRQAKGSDAPSPAYLEALMAFYEGHTDDAIARLDALEHQLPWFYEAPLLRGSLLRMRGWNLWNQGQQAEAQATLEAGRKALAAAALSGRSAPVVYAAEARLERDAFQMARWSNGRVEDAFQRGLRAVDTALEAQADHVPSLIMKAALLGDLADVRASRGEPADPLVEQAVAVARQALAAGPTRLDAWAALGKAYYQWGSARQDQNLEPTGQLAKALEALESISQEKRDYDVENHIGLIHQTWSDADQQRGRDPLVHLNGAIAAYQRAARMEPYQLPAWINLATCLQQRAVAPRALQPDQDLQAALEALDQAQRLNPGHFVPYFVRGKVRYHLALLKRNRGEDPGPDLLGSAEANRQGLAINPTIPHLHNGLGLALLELARTTWNGGGDPLPGLAKAESAFQRAITLAPRQVFGYLNLGDLLILKARWERGQATFRSLKEASRVLHRGLLVAPEHLGTLNNLALMEVVEVQALAREGGDPTRIHGEGALRLAKVLARDPRNPDALKYRGELEAAFAVWKGRQRRASAQDFDGAVTCLQQALGANPDDQETRLTLGGLWLERATWEGAQGLDPGTSLTQGRQQISGLLNRRPKWGEAWALSAGLSLEAAASLQGEARLETAGEARQAFERAFSLNPNLIRDWQPAAERAARLR